MKFFVRVPFMVLDENRQNEESFTAEVSLEAESKDEAIKKFLLSVQVALKPTLKAAEIAPSNPPASPAS